MRTLLLENESIKIETENSIIIGTIKLSSIDITSAKKINISRLEIQKGKLQPMLSDIKFVRTVSKEARDFMASEEGCEGVLAAAILVDSPITRMIGNFFMSINKPLVPTKIFTDEAEAIKWLKPFVA